MPDYDLRLGPRAFEQLIVALSRLEIGPGVQTFGDGKDGGREATFDGTINWAATAVDSTDPCDSWSGYTILQAKHRLKPSPEHSENALWLKKQIGEEIAKWTQARKDRTRNRFPDYLIFVTNVELTPVAQTGGIDAVTEYTERKLTEAADDGFRLKGFMVWHADQISSMIDAHPEVRWAFPGMLTPGDIIAALGTPDFPLGSLAFADPLREEILRSLKRDRRVRLSEAGGQGDEALWLDEIGIDLPALVDNDARSSVRALRHVLDLGNANLRPRQPYCITKPHVVVVGGPGQGKSTLSQLIAQAYRVAMLDGADVGPSVRGIIEDTGTALGRLGLQVPKNRRWPVRVDLAKYAEELSVGTETTLLRWISTSIGKKTEQTVTPLQLREWLRDWPWALILDGLDEVPSTRTRLLLHDQINDLLTTAEDLDADLLIVVTTRPTGYDERFSPDHYRHLHLQRLPAEEAATYAKQIADRRYDTDPEMRSKVAERMAAASQDPVSARLMETPLQVMIMSLIVEKYPNLPPDRYTLFNRYYETVFDREISKETTAARFLNENRDRIDLLHEQVGLALQVASESANGADASMLPEALKAMIRGQLARRGFSSEESDSIADQLMEAATKRLVLLTPREEGLSFEVRSLQELMAARALTEGEDDDVLQGLRLIAHSPHWRNTWLLSAGRLLRRSDRFEAKILLLLRTLDSDSCRLGSLFPTAPHLAGDLLQDNLAARRPGFEQALLQQLFKVVAHPALAATGQTAEYFFDAAHGAYRKTVYDRLASASTAGAASRAAAYIVLTAMSAMAVNTGTRNSIDLARRALNLSASELLAVQSWPRSTSSGSRTGSALDAETREVAEYLLSLVRPLLDEDESYAALQAGLAGLAGATFVMSPGPMPAAVLHDTSGIEPKPLLEMLAFEDVAVALELGLTTLPSSHWVLEALLGWVLKPGLDRHLVGQKTLALIQAATVRGSIVNE